MIITNLASIESVLFIFNYVSFSYESVISFNRLSLICRCNGARMRYDQGFLKPLFLFVVLAVVVTTFTLVHIHSTGDVVKSTAETGEDYGF